MVRNKKIIIAIGGGGFTHSSDEDLDKYVINQVNKSNINIGFLPTASNDNQEKIDLFYKRFKSQKLKLSHFNLCSSVEGFNEWMLNKDIIYVGGGNTSEMINIWKRHDLIKVFKDAYEKGINFLDGSCTPHSSDNNRLRQFISEIQDGKLPDGIAIDDGVAVLFIDGVPSEVYSSRINHDAYYVTKHDKISLKTYIKKLNG